MKRSIPFPQICIDNEVLHVPDSSIPNVLHTLLPTSTPLIC